jgi:hypothetical protein
MSDKKRKKPSPWKNYGDKTQVYDVVFEVDKLDFARLKNGKDSSEYKDQHLKTVELLKKYNSENKDSISLSISKCRSIIQSERYDDSVKFTSQTKNNGE